MKPSIIIREYSATTGELINSDKSFSFGNIFSGEISEIYVFDFVITSVSNISDFYLSLVGSNGVNISSSLANIENNIADIGNFGIENSSSFEVKSDLSSYFSDLNTPISIPLRDTNITNFIYLNLSPGNFEKANGEIEYKISLKCFPMVSSSSSSSSSSN